MKPVDPILFYNLNDAAYVLVNIAGCFYATLSPYVYNIFNKQSTLLEQIYNYTTEFGRKLKMFGRQHTTNTYNGIYTWNTFATVEKAHRDEWQEKGERTKWMRKMQKWTS